MIKLAPSILSADFANLKRDVDMILSAGADMVHVDVMDGHFVPNISIGVPVVKSLRAACGGFLDVHLMISRPDIYLDPFIKAGADLLNMHIEAIFDHFGPKGPQMTVALLEKIRATGKKAALTIKPATAPEAIFPFLHLCDMALVMSVEPGFGGQSFMESSLPKIRAIKDEIVKKGYSCLIQVDGGITLENAHVTAEAGADILVAGSSVFGADDPVCAVKAFKGI